MPDTVTLGDAQYAYELVKTICTEVGPGLPGTRQERRRAAIIRRELEAQLGVRDVALEEFSVAPAALVSAFPVSASLMLLAALLSISTGRWAGAPSWVTAAAALVLSILSLLIFVLQFVLNRGVLDRWLRKAQSVNVIGSLRRPGTDNVQRLLIVSGHHDSAPANNMFGLLHDVARWCLRNASGDRAQEQAMYRRLGNVFYVVSTLWLLGFITMLGLAITQLAGALTANASLMRMGTLGWALLACPIGPSILCLLFFTRRGKDGGIVPGAVDNLSASALAVAACRFLERNPSYIPAGTEIRFISFGSEEAGVRGSRRYVERHLDELKRMNARVLNIETVADPEMVILTGEASGFVKVPAEIVQSLVGAAERAGVPHRISAPWFGAGGDAAPFCQAGLRATTLLPFKMPEQAIAFYHQKWDRPDVLNLEALQNVLRLAVEWIRCRGE
jgi:hypothetical protein